VAQYLALAGGELIELRVEPCRGRLGVTGRCQGVEHESGQARCEDGVATGGALNRLHQLAALDGLGDVAARTGADQCDDVLGAAGDR